MAVLQPPVRLGRNVVMATIHNGSCLAKVRQASNLVRRSALEKSRAFPFLGRFASALLAELDQNLGRIAWVEKGNALPVCPLLRSCHHTIS